jgi:hypothetical protein
MLEPSDLRTAVRQLCLAFGLIMTVAVLLATLVVIGSYPVRVCSVMSMALTGVGYALQLMTPRLQNEAILAVILSWMAGVFAIGLFLGS